MTFGTFFSRSSVEWSHHNLKQNKQVCWTCGSEKELKILYQVAIM